jgi:hypothetical protein
MNGRIHLACAVLAVIFNRSIQASEETIGPKGINSIATGRNGMGVVIGQVEPS